MFRKIGPKLIIIMVAMCLVPVCVLGVVTNIVASKKLTERLEKSNTQMLALIDSSLDDYFSSIAQLLDTTSSFDAVKMKTEGKDKTILSILKAVQETRADVDYTYLTRTNGRMLIYPEVTLPADFNPKTREWYRSAEADPGVVKFNRPYRDAATGALTVTMSKGVVHNKTLTGVLALDCSLNEVSNTIANKEIGHTGEVEIIDAYGFIIMSPDSSRIGTRVHLTSDWWEFIIFGGDKDFGLRDEEGVKKFITYHRNKKTGWYLVAKHDHNELVSETRLIGLTTVGVSIGAALLSFIIAYLVGRAISKNIARVVESLSYASKGNFTKPYTTKGKDEFKQLSDSITETYGGISTLINSVSNSADDVQHSANSLDSLSNNVDHAVVEVTHNVESITEEINLQDDYTREASNEVEKLNEQLERVAVTLENMSNLFSSTKDLSNSGLTKVQDLKDKASLTLTANEEMSKAIETMIISLKNIDVISDTLANITSQTNLLSLNASIEAARAGDAGRGFAVVADEVRKLAEESKLQTEQINKIIVDIRKNMEMILDSVGNSRNAINSTTSATEETQGAFNEILECIKQLNTTMEVVAGIAQESDGTKVALNNVIEKITEVSSKNVSATSTVMGAIEEINASMTEVTNQSKELYEQSEQLKSKLGQFVVE